jgi:hypothetical protein
VTISGALWCHRKTVIAARFSTTTAAHQRGRIISAVSRGHHRSARPICTMASMTVSSEGGLRFERFSPGTPTRAAG